MSDTKDRERKIQVFINSAQRRDFEAAWEAHRKTRLGLSHDLTPAANGGTGGYESPHTQHAWEGWLWAKQGRTPSAFAEHDPLTDFADGQWWVLELDGLARAAGATHEQKRAVAVVHNLLRTVAAVNAQDETEEKAADTWRRLALQFDGHRMQALGHLKVMLDDPAKHAGQARAFVNGPPLSGEEVLAQRIKALAATKETDDRHAKADLVAP